MTIHMKFTSLTSQLCLSHTSPSTVGMLLHAITNTVAATAAAGISIRIFLSPTASTTGPTSKEAPAWPIYMAMLMTEMASLSTTSGWSGQSLQKSMLHFCKYIKIKTI